MGAFQMKGNGLNYKLGLRTVKSAIAVALCVLVSIVVGDRDAIFFAGVAVVICMQQTQEETVRMGICRFAGTVLGGVLGYALIKIGVLFPDFQGAVDLIAIPLSTLVAIYLCGMFYADDAVSIAIIVSLKLAAEFMSHSGAEAALPYVFDRVLYTFVGILIAIAVNRLVFPYKREQTGDAIDIPVSKS